MNSTPNGSSNMSPSALVMQLEHMVIGRQQDILDADVSALRRVLSAALFRSYRGIESPDDKEIGKVYGEIGVVIADANSKIRIQLNAQPTMPNDVVDIVFSVNEDIETGSPMITFEAGLHVVGDPPSDDDLDVIADTISIRSKGKMHMGHSCPALDNPVI